MEVKNCKTCRYWGRELGAPATDQRGEIAPCLCSDSPFCGEMITENQCCDWRKNAPAIMPERESA